MNTVDGVFTLNELGTISQKSSSLVVVNMSSLPNYIPDVVAAIHNSNLNVNPQQDGAKIMLFQREPARPPGRNPSPPQRPRLAPSGQV